MSLLSQTVTKTQQKQPQFETDSEKRDTSRFSSITGGVDEETVVEMKIRF
jgi:hypothetical protein